jgi:2-methylisocitrate lyase-like PEP mutase family enzyme
VRARPDDDRGARGPVSAAALRALHVPGDPLVLANAWDAGTARLVEQAGFPAVATTSSGVAEALGYEDGEQTPVDEMLAAVARVARAVAVPVTADMEAGYGLDDEALAQRVAATGAVGLNLEDTDHPNHPALVPVDRHAARIARIKESADLVVNARVDVHLRGGETAEALDRARAYNDAGADCVYPIGVADEATIAGFVELGVPVNILLRPGAPPIARLAELGVARVSLGHFLHAEAMDGLRARLAGLRRA